MAPVEVVTFGESMVSVRAAGLLRHGGAASMALVGAESNVAIGLSRLGHSVGWTGRVGNDELGQLIQRTLRAEAVTATAIADDERRTGLMLVEKRIADVSRVAYYRAGSAGSALSSADLSTIFDGDPRIVHITGITPALSESAAAATLWAVDAAAERGVTISFDVNYRAALWGREQASELLSRIARKAAIVFASDDELSLVSEGSPADAAAALIDAGVGEVVVKRGGDGASAWNAAGAHSIAARPVRVVDTIGAGDAFTAGYLSALLDGADLDARLDRGAVLGAFAVSGSGDWELLPTRAELSLLDSADGHTVR